MAKVEIQEFDSLKKQTLGVRSLSRRYVQCWWMDECFFVLCPCIASNMSSDGLHEPSLGEIMRIGVFLSGQSRNPGVGPSREHCL